MQKRNAENSAIGPAERKMKTSAEKFCKAF